MNSVSDTLYNSKLKKLVFMHVSVTSVVFGVREGSEKVLILQKEQRSYAGFRSVILGKREFFGGFSDTKYREGRIPVRRATVRKEAIILHVMCLVMTFPLPF